MEGCFRWPGVQRWTWLGLCSGSLLPTGSAWLPLLFYPCWPARGGVLMPARGSTLVTTVLGTHSEFQTKEVILHSTLWKRNICTNRRPLATSSDIADLCFR